MTQGGIFGDESREKKKRFRVTQGQIWEKRDGSRVLVHHLVKGWAVVLNEEAKMESYILSKDKNGETLSSLSFVKQAESIADFPAVSIGMKIQ